MEGGASSRLTYQAPAAPLELELLRLDTGVEAFLNLQRGRFESQTVAVHLAFPEYDIEESLPVRAGQTRVRLSPEASEQLVAFLARGDSVLISVEDATLLVDSDTFSRVYTGWLDRDTHLLETALR